MTGNPKEIFAWVIQLFEAFERREINAIAKSHIRDERVACRILAIDLRSFNDTQRDGTQLSLLILEMFANHLPTIGWLPKQHDRSKILSELFTASSYLEGKSDDAETPTLALLVEAVAYLYQAQLSAPATIQAV